MPYAYLVGAVCAISLLSILGACYNKKNEGAKNPVPLYNFLVCAASCVTWAVIYAFDFSFAPKALLYSLGFGVCYACVMLGLLKALATGPLALTSLIQKLSLIGVTVWGFLFWGTWNTKKAPLVLSGLILVVIALCLCLYSGKQGKGKISGEWIAYVSLAFLGNAGCSIFQKSQQIAFHGQHGSMFMFFAVALAAVISFIAYWAQDKRETRTLLKNAGAIPIVAGVSNALGNLFVVLLATTTLSPNLIYPTIAIGGLMITSTASVVLFKERLRWWQWFGVAVGALAVTLLSIQ